MARRNLACAAAALCAIVALGTPAGAAGRIDDKQLARQIDVVESGLDRFVDKMNPQMRTAVIRNERGEINVKTFLADLEASRERMEDRYKPQTYSAGTEALAFLRQAKQLDKGIADRPGMSGADATWDDLRPQLRALADAYDIDWDSDPAGWTATRVSDRELKAALKGLEQSTKAFQKGYGDALKKDKALDAGTRASSLATLSALTAAAKEASSRFPNGQNLVPAVERLATSGAQAKGLAAGKSLAPQAQSAWTSVERNLGVVRRAFKLGI